MAMSERARSRQIRVKPVTVTSAGAEPEVPRQIGTAEPPLAIGARTKEILDQPRRSSRSHRRGWVIRRMLLMGDLAGFAVAAAAVAILGDLTLGYGLAAALGVGLAKMHGLYERDAERAYHSSVDDAVGLIHVVTLSTFLPLVVSEAIGHPQAIDGLIAFWAVATVMTMTNRVIVRAFTRRMLAYQQNTIIVGAGDVGQLIGRKIQQHPEYGINLVGFIDARPRETRGDLDDFSLLGTPSDLAEVTTRLDVERIIVAFSGERDDDTLELVRSLRDHDVQIDIVPRLFEALGTGADLHAIEGLPLIGLPSVRISQSSRWLKRGFDLTVATVLFAVLLPLFAVISFKVWRGSPGPVFFRQTRLGMGQKEFTMLKFRTMYEGTDEAVHRDYIRDTMNESAAPNANGLYKLSRADAVTKVGQWLRRTSLDELPQLINIIRGEMSLVGPRPCIPYETEFFETYHFERFLVPQGVTGLWQVEGRALMTPKEALDLDVAYARGWSFGLDLSLILRTVQQVVKPDRAC